MSRRIGTHLAPLERRDVLAVEDDLAGRRLEQLDDRAAQRRLAAAGLPDDPERLAAAAPSRSTPSTALTCPTVCLKQSRLDREVFDETLDARSGSPTVRRRRRFAATVSCVSLTGVAHS